METLNWENEFAELLTDLSAAQGELLELLGEKWRRMAASGTADTGILAPREQALIERLQACQERRNALAINDEQHTPSGGMLSLAEVIPDSVRRVPPEPDHAAEARRRLLSNSNLAHWGLLQRTLLQLSQLLESNLQPRKAGRSSPPLVG